MSVKCASSILFSSILLLIVPEWLFLATKVSFLDAESVLRGVLCLPNTLFLLFTQSLILVLLFSVFFGNEAGRAISRLVAVSVVFAAFLVISDNMTYNFFGVGILSLRGVFRICYMLSAVVVFCLIYIKLKKLRPSRTFVAVAWSVYMFSAAISYLDFFYLPRSFEDPGGQKNPNGHLPNIILFASDGVEANHLSLYGYKRNTTPNLDRLAEKSIIFENAFTNAGRTTPSTTSMLTGKNPLTIGVFSPYNLLIGKNSFEHLPGILKQYGYTNFQESIKFWADSIEINMRNSFDVANGKKIGQIKLPRFVIPEFHATESRFFDYMLSKIWDRMAHIFFLETAVVSHSKVVFGKKSGNANIWSISDDERMDRAVRFMETTKSPFFMHIHLVSNTHCQPNGIKACSFSPKTKTYSGVPSPGEDDFYDDAILSSDIIFGRLIEWLELNHKLNDTVIVYSSDHGRRWSIDQKVPLVFYLPNSAKSVRIKENASLLDIGPTLLDYLDIEIPNFMEGRSLIANSSPQPIFSVDGTVPLERVHLIECQNLYSVVFKNLAVKHGQFKDHTQPCVGPSLSKKDVRQQVVNYVLPRTKMLGMKEESLMQQIWSGGKKH